VSSRLCVAPITITAAREWVARHHRHNQPPQGALFAVAVVDAEGQTRGVALVGRPVARALQDGRTAEVTRVCTDGTPNACSMLYGACKRAAFALGYTRLFTYTLQEEPGSSLRASGWTADAYLRARPTWSCPSRPRTQIDAERPPGPKVRWVLYSPKRAKAAKGGEGEK
jgi:hypothetical protein